MKCKKCNSTALRNGKSKNGTQRYRCNKCGIHFQEAYQNRAYIEGINDQLVVLLKESCGTRSISRILGISATTVTRRILQISKTINKPPIVLNRNYEMDEMMSYIGKKDHRICIAYAIDRDTKEVVGFSVGRRNQATLRMVVNTLLLADAREIRTDKFSLYFSLIPNTIHKVKKRGTNHIERKNLTLRTHIKRLNRKTIAYSKSLLVLSAILRIYFWFDHSKIAIFNYNEP